MKNLAHAFLAIAVLVCLMPAAGLALTPYNQNFEGLVQTDPDALADDGWLVFGNVFDPEGLYLYGYGPFAAPNDGFGFCQIASGEGGTEQGEQQLVVFSDYNNDDHGNGNTIESNVFQEQVIDPENVDEIWAFRFQAKLGNLEGSSTAAAFIKTLDPDNGYELTNFITLDTTSIPTTWNGYVLSIEIDASLAGQILQIGFMNTATNYEGSAVFYDNIDFQVFELTDVPVASATAGATLRQNFPNPFNPETRIEFTVDRPGAVAVSVFDLAGRRIATLYQGGLEAGVHHVTWNGRDDNGSPAPAGQYRYVLKTAQGQVSRSMVLLK
jgi:hypothetical protein